MWSLYSDIVDIVQWHRRVVEDSLQACMFRDFCRIRKVPMRFSQARGSASDLHRLTDGSAAIDESPVAFNPMGRVRELGTGVIDKNANLYVVAGVRPHDPHCVGGISFSLVKTNTLVECACLLSFWHQSRRFPRLPSHTFRYSGIVVEKISVFALKYISVKNNP